MSILRSTALLAALILALASPTQASVDVTGDPTNARTKLTVIDKLPGHSYAPRSAAGSPKSLNVLTPLKNSPPPDCDDLQGIFDACLDDIIMPREEPEDPDEPVKPELTRGRLLTAVRELTLPSLKINIQPGGETLINFDTIFYAQPQPFQRSITLLDYDIDVKAAPSGYTWHHGDGTSHTTSTPGAAYPSKAVTHRYQKKAKSLRPSVDVTYNVTFRVDNGPWQDLGQTLTANGPAGTLDVLEATAVLTEY